MQNVKCIMPVRKTWRSCDHLNRGENRASSFPFIFTSEWNVLDIMSHRYPKLRWIRGIILLILMKYMSCIYEHSYSIWIAGWWTADRHLLFNDDFHLTRHNNIHSFVLDCNCNIYQNNWMSNHAAEANYWAFVFGIFLRKITQYPRVIHQVHRNWNDE